MRPYWINRLDYEKKVFANPKPKSAAGDCILPAALFGFYGRDLKNNAVDK
jgi:hypothetical protein